MVYTASPSSVDAGDAVSFNIVVRHTGASDTDAFDVLLSEVLPPEFEDVIIASVIHSSAGYVQPSFSYTMATNTVATSDPLGFDLRLGETLTLVVTANVKQIVSPAQSLTGNADLRWTNMDGVSGVERTGQGGVNDYRTTESVIIDVIQPSTTKDLIGTSVVDANNLIDDVVIGELVQYRVRVQIPESTIDSARILDTLDVGLEFVSFDSVSVSSGGSPTFLVTSNGSPIDNPALFPPSISGQVLTFDFGQIVNADNANSDFETLEIVYTARVVNLSGNQQADTLGNEAQFFWTPGVTSQSTSSDSAVVNVLEPTLQVSHVISHATGDAFDAVTYTSTISHATGSDADAYDTTFLATLSSDFNVTSFTVTHSVLGDLTSQFELTAGNQLRTRTRQSVDIDLTESLMIVAVGNIDSDVMPGDVLSSDAQIAWTSLDGSVVGERTGDDGVPINNATPLNNYVAADRVLFAVDPILLSKSLVGTSVNDSSNAANEAVIGELVTYQLVVTMPEGEADSLVITDAMDLGLEFVSLDSVVNSTGLVSTSGSFLPMTTGDGRTVAQTLSFDLADLNNSNTANGVTETLVLTYTARVTNIAANASNGNLTGTILDESASLTYDHRGATLTTPIVTANNVEVIEPELNVSFSVSDDTPHLNQVIRYTATIDHTPGSDATAHDLTFIDAFPPGMQLVSVNVSGANIIFDGSNSSSVGLLLDTLPTGNTVTIEYDVRMTNSLSAIGNILQNDPLVRWTSLADNVFGGSGAERDWDAGNAGEDDYLDVATETVTITHPLVEVTQTTVASVPAASGTQGNFDIIYDLTIISTGNDPLTQIAIDEDFSALFGAGFVRISGNPVVTASTANDPLEINGGYDGTTINPSIIDNSGGNTNRMLQGESVTLRLTVEVDPDQPGAVLTGGEFVAQASVSALGEGSGLIAVDLSDDPGNVANVELDPVNDGEPDDPNTHRFPVLTITKDVVGSPIPAASGIQGRFDVTYRIVVENDGSTPLVGLAVAEDLQTQFGAAFVGLVGTPTIASSAIDPPGLNASFTGMTSDSQLFDGTTSRLAINESVTVTFVVEVDPDALGANRNAVSAD